MLKMLAVVAVLLVAIVVVSNQLGRVRRRRAVAALEPYGIRLRAQDASVQATLRGVPSFAGLDPERLNVVVADLAVTEDRVRIVSDRGVLADLSPEHGRPFQSARCTGPGRLVIEGDVPRGDGSAGQYRFDITIDDAERWALELARFARPGAGGARFATVPPAV